MPNTLAFTESIKVVKDDVKRLEKRVDKVEYSTLKNTVAVTKIDAAVCSNTERSKKSQECIEDLEKRIDTLDKHSISVDALTSSTIKNITAIDKGMSDLTKIVSGTIEKYHELDKKVMKTSFKVGGIIAGLTFISGLIASNITTIISWIR